jgi:hypothetical protein
MEKRTLEQLEAALAAVGNDLSPRVEELAQKSTEGQLTPEESQEYAEIVRLNDMLGLLKLQAEALRTAAPGVISMSRPASGAEGTGWSRCSTSTRRRAGS